MTVMCVFGHTREQHDHFDSCTRCVFCDRFILNLAICDCGRHLPCRHCPDGGDV